MISVTLVVRRDKSSPRGQREIPNEVKERSLLSPP